MCDEPYENRLAQMSQATDSPCLALNIQESVLGLAMKTGNGSSLLTAHSTARRIPLKLLITLRFTSFTAHSTASRVSRELLPTPPPYKADWYGEPVIWISNYRSTRIA